MKRYFIVSYTFNTISKASGNGSINIFLSAGLKKEAENKLIKKKKLKI